MNLNEESITAKIYRWFYGIDCYELPTDGCEYFKKLILALLLFIPLGLITLPITIIGFIYKNKYSVGERLGFMLLFLVLMLFLFAMGCGIGLFFVHWDKTSLICRFGPAGLMCWVVILGYSIYYGVKALIEFIKERNIKYDENGYRIHNQKQDNLLVVLYKAKKEKYCPKLTWYRKN